MHEVQIRPQWTIRQPDGATLPPRVIELLVKVLEHGSLSSACAACGVSYRHAWELVRQGEAMFGQPLVAMQRGKGSSLTPLGEKLVWADRRIEARLSPLLDSLASELGAEIEKLIPTSPSLLRIHASHGFAIEALHGYLAAAQVPSDLRYCGSEEAVASLHHGSCDVAGFHVPLGAFEAEAVAHYHAWLDSGTQKLIGMATRHQGLMVAPGNPKKIYTLADLARPDVRFINRQPGSGTRYLFDLQLREQGIAPESIRGYEQCEFTHAAVAAFVASGMADAGYGVETPARQFKLDFISNQVERYFLLCDERSLAAPIVQRMLAILQGEAYRQAVNRLPGYEAVDCGRVLSLGEAFESLRPAPAAKRRTTRRS
ncbi:molybdate transport repressor ModE-like protein [Variovorax sp. TBS-050B]|uniref:helix-turn-helix transcriptional regulator n=1 Tax=Variovorax sp. TBS-050B TaxID=2940551 RepID=UPI0024757C98|nr:substrate-binding domain-containing protein [Variovorax sp. TBS-050B]MDH6594141.1 molybdate transport repressor ModE-like protein [Variovorax sp. TBS-050B]